MACAGLETLANTRWPLGKPFLSPQFLLLPVSPSAFLSGGSPQLESGPCPLWTQCWDVASPVQAARGLRQVREHQQQKKKRFHGTASSFFLALLGLPSTSPFFCATGQWDQISRMQTRPAQPEDTMIRPLQSIARPRANTAFVTGIPPPPLGSFHSWGWGGDLGWDLGICAPRF